MSKITFRADEELVERIEARDASKSEIMREALRAYLDREDAGRGPETGRGPESRTRRDREESAVSGRGGRDREKSAVSGRGGRESSQPRREPYRDSHRPDTLDAFLAERVDELVADRLDAREGRGRERPQDVNVNVTLESDAPVRTSEGATRREHPSDASSDERPDEGADAHPTDETNCGQCGESLSDDHVYCPNCGEKAARRLFCECGDEVRSDWGFCPGCGRRTPAADVLDRS